MANPDKNRALNVTRGTLLFIVYIILLTLSVILIVQAGRMAYRLSYQVFGDVVVSEPPGENISFQIIETESAWEVSENLYQKNLVVNKYTFYLRLRLTINNNRKIVPGDHTLNTSMTYGEIIEKIVLSGN
ncbi:MAG: hypothetical protein LBR68_04350 [Lachnoclostridium sp.]|jgi:cell division protein YceG involved in septum cleavage|nr:hypothetical protein [Lachnoclostridium sp.]